LRDRPARLCADDAAEPAYTILVRKLKLHYTTRSGWSWQGSRFLQVDTATVSWRTAMATVCASAPVIDPATARSARVQALPPAHAELVVHN
jgi:hypothetical protein